MSLKFRVSQPIGQITGGILLVLTSVFPAQAAEQHQMRGAARQSALEAMKVDVRPVAQGRHIGEEVPVEVSLRNANNEPVKATKDTRIEVEAIGQDGKAQRQKVEIKAGETSKTVNVDAERVGVITVKAREADDRLLHGSASVLVRPKAKQPQPDSVAPPRTPIKIKKAAPARTKPIAFQNTQPRYAPAVYQTLFGGYFNRPQVLLAAWSSDDLPRSESSSPRTTRVYGKLMLQVSDRDEGFLADGKDQVKVSAYYLSEDGEKAPTDIQVWLRWTNGELSPQPLIIRRGDDAAEATWTSRWQANASVSLVTSSPRYEVDGPKAFSVKFVPPIYGIALKGPGRLSLVDNETLFAQFYDPQGNPIQTATKRSVTFINKSPKIHLNPLTRVVEAGSSEASTLLLPAALGTSEVEASTPGYKSVIHVVAITGGMVIALWLAGGVAGSLCAFYKYRGSLLWRILTGVITAAVLTWGYVYGALPVTDAAIAHNILSVLFVSVLGGYLSIAGLDYVAKKLKLA